MNIAMIAITSRAKYHRRAIFIDCFWYKSSLVTDERIAVHAKTPKPLEDNGISPYWSTRYV